MKAAISFPLFRYFSNLRIKHKIFLSFSPLFLIGIILMTYLFYNIAEYTVVVNASRDNLNIVKQISEKIEIVSQNIISVSNMYFLDEDVRKLLKSPRPDDNNYENTMIRRSIKEKMEMWNNHFLQMKHSVVIAGFGDVYFTSYDNLRDRELDQIRIDTWLAKVEADKDKILWTGTYYHKERHIFSAMRYIRDIYTGKPLGMLILDFEEQILYNMYQNLQEKDILILNADGIVMSGRDKQLVSSDYSGMEFFRKMTGYQSGYFITDYSGKKTLVSFYKVKPMNWYVVELSPLNHLTSKMQDIKSYFLLLTVAILAIIFLFSYALAHVISSPIKKLVASMSRTKSGNFTQLLPLNRKDEIGVLVSTYNSMIDKINQLMKEMAEQHEMKRKADIRALLAQVNPHFLYNTLNSIRWMAKTNRPDMVNRMIISLVRLLKQTISTPNEFISIAEERQFLEDYILIQKVRYGDKFDVRIEFAQDILSGKTIKLLLQPILENAIFHGIEPKEGPGRIAVTGYRKENRVVFEVSDDGVGMDLPGEKSSIGQVLEHYQSLGKFGLQSIDQRIRMHFGNQYGMSVHSERGKGTKVTLVLPWIESIDDNH